MAYVQDEIALWKYQQDRDTDTRKQFGNMLSGIAGTVVDDRKRALESKRKSFETSSAFAKEGVSITDDEMAELETTGSSSSLLNKYASQAETARAAKAAKEKSTAALDEEYKRSQIAKNLAYRPAGSGAAKVKTEDAPGYVDPELFVPGMGEVRTKKEAIDMRQAVSDAAESKAIIEQIKKLGTNVAIWDRDRIGKINQLKSVLVGKLRVPLLGPGTMTEDEFQRLVSNMGDPSAMFGSEKNELSKLDQLAGILDNSVKSKFSATSKSSVAPKNEADEFAEYQALMEKKRLASQRQPSQAP
jgi:hypothetical protein